MASTSADLVNDVLRKLDKLEPGADADSGDSEYITRVQKLELAQLRKRQIAYWTYNSIPDEVCNSYVDYIAAIVAPRFGVPSSQADVDAAREKLATDAKPRFSGASMKSDYPVTTSNTFDFTRGY
jgi:hypothetical protein